MTGYVDAGDGERLRALAPFPLAVAPMAGGPSTVELVVAGAQAGAFAFLAGGYKKAGELRADMASVRVAGVDRFGVNLFVPGAPTGVPDRLEGYVASLRPLAESFGTELGAAVWDDDDYPRKLELVLAEAPAVVSFTFGLPSLDAVRVLRAAGSLVMVTVTTPEEATVALDVGPDAALPPGCRGGRPPRQPGQQRPTRRRPPGARLLAAVRRRTLVPLVAAGGVGGPEDVADLLQRGATLVQAGTAFLRCPESGAPPAAKGALGDPAFGATAVTRAFSGRRAAPSSTPWCASTPVPRPCIQRSTTPRARSERRRRRPATPGT